MNKELELRLIDNYIIPSKKERAKFELFENKKRESFIWNLDARKYLDEKHTFSSIKSVDSFEKVYLELKKLGFSNICYVISVEETYDAQTLSLKDALKGLIFNGPALIATTDGNLAYFEGEPNLGYTQRVLLKILS